MKKRMQSIVEIVIIAGVLALGATILWAMMFIIGLVGA
jgi:hypothetical protein